MNPTDNPSSLGESSTKTSRPKRRNPINRRKRMENKEKPKEEMEKNHNQNWPIICTETQPNEEGHKTIVIDDEHIKSQIKNKLPKNSPSTSEHNLLSETLIAESKSLYNLSDNLPSRSSSKHDFLSETLKTDSETLNKFPNNLPSTSNHNFLSETLIADSKTSNQLSNNLPSTSKHPFLSQNFVTESESLSSTTSFQNLEKEFLSFHKNLSDDPVNLIQKIVNEFGRSNRDLATFSDILSKLATPENIHNWKRLFRIKDPIQFFLRTTSFLLTIMHEFRSCNFESNSIPDLLLIANAIDESRTFFPQADDFLSFDDEDKLIGVIMKSIPILVRIINAFSTEKEGFIGINNALSLTTPLLSIGKKLKLMSKINAGENPVKMMMIISPLIFDVENVIGVFKNKEIYYKNSIGMHCCRICELEYEEEDLLEMHKNENCLALLNCLSPPYYQFELSYKNWLYCRLCHESLQPRFILTHFYDTYHLGLLKNYHNPLKCTECHIVINFSNFVSHLESDMHQENIIAKGLHHFKW